jgi:hypothetical protein
MQDRQGVRGGEAGPLWGRGRLGGGLLLEGEDSGGGEPWDSGNRDSEKLEVEGESGGGEGSKRALVVFVMLNKRAAFWGYVVGLSYTVGAINVIGLSCT